MLAKRLLFTVIIAWLSVNGLQTHAAYPPPWVVADVSSPKLENPYENSPSPNPSSGFRMITASVVNMSVNDLPCVVILEIRDETGVTHFLAFHVVELKVDGRSDIASSWLLPQEQGAYELRSFVISNFTRPQALTPIKTNQDQSCL